MYVILAYDILADKEGARVSRNVFKICNRYLTNIQKSMFEGNLSELKLKSLESEISKHIRKDRDSLVVFKNMNEKWLQKEFWGLSDDKTSNIF